MSSQSVLIYYKYTKLDRPRDLMVQQRSVCHELGLKGRILLASEGINGTVEGDNSSLQKYIAYMDAHPDFFGISFKQSASHVSAFPKLIVRVRREIVTSELGPEDVDPNQTTGKYLSADDLHQWFEQGRKFKIVDMRNDYEQLSGHFEGSILSGMENFRDLKKTAKKLENIKGETIVTVCTGGVRCEKASGYLVQQGFPDVYQLKDGIVSYMEKYPNQHFKGKLYVFDNRMVMGFETDSPDHMVIGRCELCLKPSENYINCGNNLCHKHFICCQSCHINGIGACTKECYQAAVAV